MLHREGWTFLIVLAIILIGVNVASWYFLAPVLFWLLLVGSVVLFVFFLQFFRNPKRPLTRQAEAIVSPADGRVVVIERTHEDEFFKDERIQLSIFMSPLNVHINRAPVPGRLVYYKYHPGKFMVAFHPKSSQLNERNTAVFETPANHRILMRQIAGAVARRIKFYMKENDTVEQAQEVGFIKFGSRVDLFLPLDAEIKVDLEQTVRGGQTVLAVVK